MPILIIREPDSPEAQRKLLQLLCTVDAYERPETIGLTAVSPTPPPLTIENYQGFEFVKTKLPPKSEPPPRGREPFRKFFDRFRR